MRGNIEVDKQNLKKWREDTYVVYARDVVTYKNKPYPLVMSVSLMGNFIVSLDTDMLYNGKSLAKAIEMFNMNFRDIIKAWKSLDKTMTNSVKHKEVESLHRDI